MKRVVSGILTFVAVIFAVLMFVKFGLLFVSQMDHPGGFQREFWTIWVSSMLYNFLSFGLLIFYIVDVVKNKAFTSDKRVLWVLLLIFGRLITMIVYWFIHILPDKEEEDEDVIVMGDK